MLFVSKSAAWKGPTNSLLLILRHLNERYDASVLVPGSGAFVGELERDGVPVFSFDSLDKYAIPGMVRLIRRGGFDLVYGNSTSGSSRNALIASKLAGVPFICHVREMGKPKKWKKLGFLRYATAIIAVSEAAARSVTPYAGKRRIHVIHNGVDSEPGSVDRAAAGAGILDELNLARDATVLVNVGYLSERKGQDYAVQALRRVVDIDASVHLLLVGARDVKPDYARRIEDRIHDLDLDDHVHLLGFRQDVPAILRAADILVHTAVSDPHPRAVLEAMAAGLPVVAFAVDGVAETVVHTETGYLVPPCSSEELAEAVSSLTRSRALRARYGSAGLRRVRQTFGAERTGQAVGDVIDGVLDGSRSVGKRARMSMANLRMTAPRKEET